MKLNKPFHAFSMSDYHHVIKHHERYTNFNPLGLYRSVLENPKLDTTAQLEILNLANQHFGKFYEFLIVKDIHTYAELSLIGKEPLTVVQKHQYIMQLREKAEIILKQKRIRNWRVGIYTKSSRWAGYDEHSNTSTYVQIMTKERSKKWYKSTNTTHIKARKHKAVIIRRILDENG